MSKKPDPSSGLVSSTKPTLAQRYSDRCAELEKLRARFDLLQGDVGRAEAQRDLAYATIEELKVQLFDTSQELARLRGYIERVEQDDTVREELISIERHRGEGIVEKSLTPKRALSAPPKLDWKVIEPDTYLGYKSKDKPKHWVNK